MEKGQRKYRVLVVDEDDDWRELLLFALADEGYAVGGAKGAAAAWRLLQRLPCHVVLGADRLGDLDGISYLKAVKEHFPDLQCVALAGSISGSRLNKRLPPYLAGAVYKPFDPEEIKLLLRRLLHPRLAWFRKWTEKWRLLKEKMSLRWRKWQLMRAAEQRNKCFKSFFDYVRSGHLLLGGALAVWDGLEELEAAQNQALTGSVDCRALADAYRRLGEAIAESAHFRRCYWPKQRDETAVDYQVFAAFFEKVRRGELTLEQLRLAPALRRAEHLSSDLKHLFQQIWGCGSRPAAPWSQARLDAEKGTGIWQSKSLKIKKLVINN